MASDSIDVFELGGDKQMYRKEWDGNAGWLVPDTRSVWIKHSIYLAALTFTALLSAAEPNTSDRLYNAIRSGDESTVKQIFKSGAPVNIKDRRGGTPLHYAAAVGTPNMMKLLIAGGADVNARTTFGATPLLWSVASPEKVELLVTHGADVNARSQMGNTALTTAAAQAANIDVVRYLLSHGASIGRARNELGQTPVLRAAGANDFEMVNLLVRAGDDPAARDSLGFTPLMFASASGNVEMLKLLIASHANVNAQTEPAFNRVKNGPIQLGKLSPLMLAVVSRNRAAVRILLDAGANVNAKDARGMTPLMLAVASDHADPEIVRLLLEKSPDLTTESDVGETAAHWAMKFRSRTVLDLIPGASKELDEAGTAGRKSTSTPDVRQAAEKSLALMQSSTATFFRNGGCVSCHAQHITGMAVAIARRKALRFDESAAEEVLRATRLEFASRSDQFLERIDGPADLILTTALFALATQNVPADRMTDAMIRNIATQQQRDGSWPGIGIVRPPTADWHISHTAQAIRVLRDYAPPALKDEFNRRIARALTWLTNEQALTTEDAVMQLLGARWAGADEATLERFRRKVLALQGEDGGWAQKPEFRPDAYATGTALYALSEGGGVAPDSSAFRRGVAFLLKTQALDGSWLVVSRAPKFQPYFESGFPYGHNQWISQWATGWGAIALTLAVPDNVP